MAGIGKILKTAGLNFVKNTENKPTIAIFVAILAIGAAALALAFLKPDLFPGNWKAITITGGGLAMAISGIALAVFAYGRFQVRNPTIEDTTTVQEPDAS